MVLIRAAERASPRLLIAACMLSFACTPALRPSEVAPAGQADGVRVLAQFRTRGASQNVTAPTVWNTATGAKVDPGAWSSVGDGNEHDLGWMQARLPPGSYFLNAGAAQGSIFHIADTATPYYIGSFTLGCEQPQAGCAPIDDDLSGARALATVSGLGSVAPSLARPRLVRPPAGSGSGVSRVVIDPAQWRAAINWQAVPTPPDRAAQTAREMGGIARNALRDPNFIGPSVMTGGFVFIVGAGSLGIAGSIATGLNAAVTAVERHAAEQEQQQLGPCLERAAPAFEPVHLQQRIRDHLEARAPAARAVPAGWTVELTRAVLRRCGSGRFGVEIATRWTLPARRGADAAELLYNRSVTGAQPDARLTFSYTPPWEVQLGPEAPCRPMADICATDGADRLLQDALDGVALARSAIAAPRPATSHTQSP